MNTTIHKFTLFFTTCFLGCMTGHAYEQDNWYLAWEKSIVSPFGVETWENNNTGVEQIYLCHGSNSASKISVYDLNGSFSRDIQIANARNHAVDLTIDENGTLFISERYSVTCIANDGTFKWRLGKGSSISNVGTSGQLEGEFNQDADQGVGVGILDSNIYVTDYYNHRVQVLDVNGSYKMQFSSYGTAPGTIQNPMDLDILDNKIIVASRVTNYLNIFTEDGSFLNRFQIAGNHQSHHVTVFNDTFVYRGKLYSPSIETITQGTPLSSSEHIRYAFTNNGDLIESGNNKLRLWKRAYRTKGLVNRNVIPQPAIRGVTQRAGTNVLDLDFEIVDPDDSNATIGIIAYAGSDKLVPQTWVDGTANKIGTPITTNQVHRVSWDVKQDWTTNTGTIKFEILCQDGRTNKPVDLHFLTLPFSDGNMTISRSPLKNSDFLNYAKFLLATGQAQFESNTSNAVVLPGDSNTTIPFTFTNCGVSGRSGPSVSQINSTYAGTSLDGNVTAGWKAGYQKWIVPVTGHYWIEAYGARGGNSAKKGGGGTFVRGKFSLTAGQILNIVVGQTGKDISGSYGASGGGGSFVVTDTNSTPLIIAGGGGGAGGTRDSIRFATGENGADTADTIGGKNGYGGQGGRSGGGGGFLGNGNSYYSGQGGLSFQFGLTGGTPTSSGDSGGFGGGGATHLNSWKQGGGGGGYSGGAAPKGDKGIFSEEGAGGGSFNSGSLQSITPGLNDGHGKVDIRPIQTVRIIDGNWNVLSECKEKLLKSLGSNYRFATTAEVTKAREAATPGAVNNWTASNQVKPRNLPGSVNEYGFDVQTTSGYWVIKE